MISEQSGRPAEAARLAALDSYQILDTPAEAGFDDIVQIAAHVCQTPVALVSLVEVNRQWFKARIGFEGCETPIEQSVCAHALAQTDLLIIPDLARDPRTAANTLVTRDPFIRFYAGAPLVTPEGTVIGTLCVIDVKPRPEGLTEAQRQVLEALGRQVMMQLEMRRVVTATEVAARQQAIDLRTSYELARTAEEAGGVGTFQVDIATSQMTVSPEYCRIFGLPVSESYPTSVSEALILAEDRSQPSNDKTRSEASAVLSVEYRIRRPSDGSIRWIARRADFVRDADGRSTKMFGVVQDITERRQTIDRQAALLELGDDMRDVTSVAEATRVASAALGRSLGGTRAGYLVILPGQDHVKVEEGWSSEGVAPIAGLFPRGGFPASVERLSAGVAMAVNDVATVRWLRNDLAAYQRSGAVAVLNVPLLERRQLVGVLFVHQDSPRAWTREEIEFATDVADRTHAVIARLSAQAEQALLNRELGHRMKNQLAMVQAIANQSLRTATDLPTASAALNARIQVLAKAHDLILTGDTGRTTIDKLVHDIATLHDNQLERRIFATGPRIEIASRPALSLALILHELSTNAAKYGALSTTEGSVQITWRIEGNKQDAKLLLVWREQGGPPVATPTRVGTGSRLIKAGLAGSTSSVDIDFDSDGVRCTIRADLVSLQLE